MLGMEYVQHGYVHPARGWGLHCLLQGVEDQPQDWLSIVSFPALEEGTFAFWLLLAQLLHLFRLHSWKDNNWSDEYCCQKQQWRTEILQSQVLVSHLHRSNTRREEDVWHHWARKEQQNMNQNEIEQNCLISKNLRTLFTLMKKIIQ